MTREKTPVDENFLSRWSRRKQTVKSGELSEPEESLETTDGLSVAQEEVPPLTDADMPPIESLTEDSDYSGFMSPGVSEELRQIALRKLFSSAAFNVVDGLDDYDEDFTSFAKLGDIVTADMRFQMEQEARKKMNELMAEDDTEKLPHQEVAEEERQEQLSAAPENEIESEPLPSEKAESEQAVTEAVDTRKTT